MSIFNESITEGVRSTAMGVNVNELDELERIPSTTLAMLRGILVKSLSRENLSLTDQQKLLAGTRKDRHVSFEDGKDFCCYWIL